jgi:hypothetical protein
MKVLSSLIDSSTVFIHLNTKNNYKRKILMVYLHHLFEVIVHRDDEEIQLND